MNVAGLAREKFNMDPTVRKFHELSRKFVPSWSPVTIPVRRISNCQPILVSAMVKNKRGIIARQFAKGTHD